MTKYTKEILKPLVAKNITMTGVMRDLKLRLTGGSHAHLRRLIDSFGLSTAHFKGSGSNFGVYHKGGCLRKKPEEFLILRSEFEPRTHGNTLRRALLESGVPEQCARCGQKPVWNSQPLLLTPDHKNGEFWDNRRENLELLCPNCHSQTETFSGKNNRLKGKWVKRKTT